MATKRSSSTCFWGNCSCLTEESKSIQFREWNEMLCSQYFFMFSGLILFFNLFTSWLWPLSLFVVSFFSFSSCDKFCWDSFFTVARINTHMFHTQIISAINMGCLPLMFPKNVIFLKLICVKRTFCHFCVGFLFCTSSRRGFILTSWFIFYPKNCLAVSSFKFFVLINNYLQMIWNQQTP